MITFDEAWDSGNSIKVWVVGTANGEWGFIDPINLNELHESTRGLYPAVHVQRGSERKWLTAGEEYQQAIDDITAAIDQWDGQIFPGVITNTIISSENHQVSKEFFHG